MEHGLKSLCATQVSRPVFLPDEISASKAFGCNSFSAQPERATL
jgi:hypothetical protein